MPFQPDSARIRPRFGQIRAELLSSLVGLSSSTYQSGLCQAALSFASALTLSNNSATLPDTEPVLTQFLDLCSEHAVNVALAINGVVFFGKLFVYFWTGSDVMLAEAVHSLADIANQVRRSLVLACTEPANSLHMAVNLPSSCSWQSRKFQ